MGQLRVLEISVCRLALHQRLLLTVILAADCSQRRPGAVFAKTVSTVKPEVIDKEYEAFLADLSGGKSGLAAGSKESYTPPMGVIGNSFEGHSKTFEGPSKTLMLTNGSAAPGAASAHARSMSKFGQQQQQDQQQQQGGGLQVVGRSIFGGNMTKMTSGYKSKMELEMEREKKKQESEFRPVPLEWQVERFEKNVQRQQEEFIDQLEQYRAEEKKKRQSRFDLASVVAQLDPIL